MGQKYFVCLLLTEMEGVAWAHGSKPVFSEQITHGVIGTQQQTFTDEKLEQRLCKSTSSLDLPKGTSWELQAHKVKTIKLVKIPE